MPSSQGTGARLGASCPPLPFREPRNGLRARSRWGPGRLNGPTPLAAPPRGPATGAPPPAARAAAPRASGARSRAFGRNSATPGPRDLPPKRSVDTPHRPPSGTDRGIPGLRTPGDRGAGLEIEEPYLGAQSFPPGKLSRPGPLLLPLSSAPDQGPRRRRCAFSRLRVARAR
jgi:hypothetical protein